MDTKCKTSESAILIILKLPSCCHFGWQCQGKREPEIFWGLNLSPGKEKICTIYLRKSGGRNEPTL